MTRLGLLESMIARIGCDNAHAYEEQIKDRHGLDALKERVERLERGLELGN
ncbi:hypothetical protein QUC32_17635 [Novosphingobium resinovorum]|jgi:hypothetical protein|uniref:hypothetical protein n=1 Tax=Sphingomonadaceae TaxID=41297 RepID=UPI0002E47470|nr:MULTISPECIES: hypothetical protein [Sphingomonadaceae]MBF7011487.1 hypothetical protein [Novosphingobium sp. HR1a]WJM29462.1 hypothetical protein QUC32_17635 [Novosphingobium resinovorum]